jgi:hypothetical protein
VSTDDTVIDKRHCKKKKGYVVGDDFINLAAMPIKEKKEW